MSPSHSSETAASQTCTASPIGINPGADGILNALEELNPQPAEKTDEHSFNRQARALSERA